MSAFVMSREVLVRALAIDQEIQKGLVDTVKRQPSQFPIVGEFKALNHLEIAFSMSWYQQEGEEPRVLCIRVGEAQAFVLRADVEKALGVNISKNWNMFT